ncbi:MAG: hypothetical protein SFV15_00460 [Polyangiaceae bacterium]|nr:hypothetical protein [Polyangiaceae bacterium]
MADASTGSFESKLPEGRQKFLAHMIEHAFQIGRRSAEDFIRHFPPATIMEGLASKPELRGQILEHTTGLKQKIAMKKSWQSAGEDLLIALTEGEADAAAIISVFAPDDRVRYLNDRKLWAFLTEGEFWNATLSKKEEYAIAKRHMAYMLERALTDKLLTHRDIVEGVTVAELAVRLPKAELGKIIQQALTAGHGGRPFSDSDLLVAMPPETLVEYIPLVHLFESAVLPKIAQAHGYTDPPAPPAEEAKPAPAAASPAAAPAAAAEESPAAAPIPDPTQEAADGEGKGNDWMEFDENEDSAIVDDEITDEDFATA